MVVVAAGGCAGHLLIVVGTATPRRRAIAAMARAAAVARGPVPAAGAVPSMVLGVWFSFRIRGRREVRLLLRVTLAAVLLSSSPSMGFAGGVFPVWVGHPRGVWLLLGFGLGHSPAAGGVLSGFMPLSYSAGLTPTIVNLALWLSCSSEMDDRPASNLSRRMPPRSPASTSLDGGSSTSCHPTHSALEKVWGSTFWGVYPFFLAPPSAWLAAAASAGEAAGLSATRWTGGGLARKVRRTSATPGQLGAWLRT